MKYLNGEECHWMDFPLASSFNIYYGYTVGFFLPFLSKMNFNYNQGI